MNNKITKNTAVRLSAGQKLPDCERIIVLAPAAAVYQEANLPQRIRQLASPGKTRVVYLGLFGDHDSEMSAARRLSQLAAVTRDKRVQAEIRLAHTSSWVEAVRSTLQPGDVVVCHAEQTAPKGWFDTRPLGDRLQTALDAPVFVMDGYFQPQTQKTPRPLGSLFSAMSLGIIVVGSFALGILITNQINGAMQQVTHMMLVCIETGAIWAWNELAG